MSIVTNVLLCFSLIEEYKEDEVVPALAHIQRYLTGRKELKSVSDCAGGGMAMEVEVYASAINHLDVDEFIEVVKAAPWRYPNYVQLLIKEENDEIFRNIDIRD